MNALLTLSRGADAACVEEQCLIEHQALGYIKAALRLTLDWQVGGAGLARKVATVRFTAQSFRRHLERLMDLEEKDGYLEVVAEMKPHLVDKARRLRDQHDQFRAALELLMPTIDTVGENDVVAVARLCDEILSLLRKVDAHDTQEMALLQEVVSQDEGGEGG